MEAPCKEQIIFTCKKCLFSTEYKQLVTSHIKNCKGNLNICPKQLSHMVDTIKLLKEEKDKLSAQLVLELLDEKNHRSTFSGENTFLFLLIENLSILKFDF